MANPFYGNTQKYHELSKTEKGRMRIQMQAFGAKAKSSTFSFNENNCLRIAYIYATASLLPKFTELVSAGSFLTVKMRALKNYHSANFSSYSLLSEFDVPIIQATEDVEGVKSNV